ncbi:transcription factor GAMYB [Olea europaea subsp. europaea]|uniref:Transcription factor GAMYB n=1 Tax=Olea europaea subsp. europaea TaxID=158383 RepID=A0A8S0QBW2_OLEEU|nr:transcription factor GAMYB [Olea europaea subsp. europaea]
MDEKRRMYDNMSEIKKGPWKEEEDKVLLSHVKKYGPRDWSSIRSKGLLRRTGKSCRLRWVNKLRPNLKTGIKFSAEEERTIIDLQGQYGNKWARIATYLPGRTDNDVKNFLEQPKEEVGKDSANDSIIVRQTSRGLGIRALEFNLGKQREDVFGQDFKQQKGNRLTDLIHPTSLNFEEGLYQLEFDPNDMKPYNLLQSSIPFPPQLNLDFPSLENQEFIMGLEVPNFFDVFGHGSASEIGNVHLPPTSSCLEPEKSAPNVTPDISLIDDFPPMDIFDHIDPFQSPSEW